jgi:hypothetical protein
MVIFRENCEDIYAGAHPQARTRSICRPLLSAGDVLQALSSSTGRRMPRSLQSC